MSGLLAKFARWFWWATHKAPITSSIWPVRSKSQNITVDLIVTLSPFLQNPIPANVVKAINYYQAPGWGQPIAPDRASHGKIINFDLAGDQTITHISIDKSARVQAEILQEITALNKAVANTAPTITTGSTPTAR